MIHMLIIITIIILWIMSIFLTSYLGVIMLKEEGWLFKLLGFGELLVALTLGLMLFSISF